MGGSDDGAEGELHAVAGGLESAGDGLSGGEGVAEGGASALAGVLEGDGLDGAAEEGVALVEVVEGGVETCDHGVGLVRQYDDFDADFFVVHGDTSTLILCLWREEGMIAGGSLLSFAQDGVLRALRLSGG